LHIASLEDTAFTFVVTVALFHVNKR